MKKECCGIWRIWVEQRKCDWSGIWTIDLRINKPVLHQLNYINLKIGMTTNIGLDIDSSVELVESQHVNPEVVGSHPTLVNLYLYNPKLFKIYLIFTLSNSKLSSHIIDNN